MSEQIEIRNENEYTAKAAMQLVLEQMKAKTEQVITVVTLGEGRWDSESVLFIKMFLRYLHKNQGRVLLLAENQERTLELEERIEQTNAQIQVVEKINLEDHGVSADMILNRINGAEAECIIASLPEDVQKQFLEQYRTSLDAKVWFGMGIHLERQKRISAIREFWSKMIRQLKK